MFRFNCSRRRASRHNGWQRTATSAGRAIEVPERSIAWAGRATRGGNLRRLMPVDVWTFSGVLIFSTQKYTAHCDMAAARLRFARRTEIVSRPFPSKSLSWEIMAVGVLSQAAQPDRQITCAVRRRPCRPGLNDHGQGGWARRDRSRRRCVGGCVSMSHVISKWP
jgi:hypothetical protein